MFISGQMEEVPSDIIKLAKLIRFFLSFFFFIIYGQMAGSHTLNNRV